MGIEREPDDRFPHGCLMRVRGRGDPVPVVGYRGRLGRDRVRYYEVMRRGGPHPTYTIVPEDKLEYVGPPLRVGEAAQVAYYRADVDGLTAEERLVLADLILNTLIDDPTLPPGAEVKLDELERRRTDARIRVTTATPAG